MTSPRRVLLVEDDAHIADLLSLHLRDEGLEVVHCAREATTACANSSAGAGTRWCWT